jgi:hypothetical protein
MKLLTLAILAALAFAIFRRLPHTPRPLPNVLDDCDWIGV